MERQRAAVATKGKTPTATSWSPLLNRSAQLLPRKCACGNHASGGECHECAQKKGLLQRQAGSDHLASEALRLPGLSETFRGDPRAATFGRDFSQMPVFSSSEVIANLPSPDDVLRQTPSATGQAARSGVQLGQMTSATTPGTAAGAAAATAVPSVFYVSFQNAAPPAAPDNSRMFPGPAGTLSDNAGYTHAVLGGRMTLPWDSGTPRADGRVPIFVRSVNIFYRLDPIEVFVSSQYRPGTCPYRVTLAHERSHVGAFTRLFHAGRDTLLAQLATLSVPTESAPRWSDPANVAAEQSTVETSLVNTVQNHRRGLKAQMDADKDAKDSPAAYAAVYAQCPAAEW